MAITSVFYKLMMFIVRDHVERCVEQSGRLSRMSETKGGFRKRRRTDDNLFKLGRIREVMEARKEIVGGMLGYREGI